VLQAASACQHKLFSVMQRLKRRQDFVAAAKALSAPMPSMVLQVRKRGDAEGPRIGFTCTKKLGNAVMRNRIKRRLKEAARLCLAEIVRPGFDYVIIGRSAAENRPFEVLKSDLISAMNRSHEKATAAFETRT
jgi:ribonuclease P protein component